MRDPCITEKKKVLRGRGWDKGLCTHGGFEGVNIIKFENEGDRKKVPLPRNHREHCKNDILSDINYSRVSFYAVYFYMVLKLCDQLSSA